MAPDRNRDVLLGVSQLNDIASPEGNVENSQLLALVRKPRGLDGSHTFELLLGRQLRTALPMIPGQSLMSMHHS